MNFHHGGTEKNGGMEAGESHRGTDGSSASFQRREGEKDHPSRRRPARSEAERAIQGLRFAEGTGVLKFKKWIANILQPFKMGALST